MLGLEPATLQQPNALTTWPPAICCKP